MLLSWNFNNLHDLKYTFLKLYNLLMDSGKKMVGKGEHRNAQKPTNLFAIAEIHINMQDDDSACGNKIKIETP
jgi:hypothetical protein